MEVVLSTALALCIHWFNPLVWGMYLLLNRDLELSCDESVVRRLDIHLQIALDESDKITAGASTWIDEDGGF